MSGNCHLKTATVDHHVWIIGRTQSSQMRQQTLRSPWSIDRQTALWSRQGASCDPRFTKTMTCEHQRGPRRTGIFKVHYHQTPSSRSSVKSAGHAGFLQAVCTLILLSLRRIPKASDSPFFWQISSPQISISFWSAPPYFYHLMYGSLCFVLIC